MEIHIKAVLKVGVHGIDGFADQIIMLGGAECGEIGRSSLFLVFFGH